MVNFLGALQNERLNYDTVRQGIQEFIYSLNVPSRWGSQTPFTNLTFDWICPEDLYRQVPIIGGKEMPFTCGELQAEMDMLNRTYIEVMTVGDAKGRVFTFQIPTYNITRDFPWESENAERLFEITAKYGLPYFQNFINSDMEPRQVRSMCCRLQLDLRELLKRGNGLFGSAEQAGSIGVVTINWPALVIFTRVMKRP
ncbi:MAG: anaerobic ribonucleoside-triphosphate reductase [Sedimenticolaceae bacterium]|uniref:anaerobic ribonucleoside-triphosphate reductase n=1 Tax=Candidatus Vondammii sp. HM_W22 TaxID=2687299 RepID=UPI002E7BEDB0|nr:anaerobic ribonucleoside-triphosphate reductase [Candidatus Vondammii sp. HM_W22]